MITKQKRKNNLPNIVI